MPVSVTEPLTPAWNRMAQILFKPFEIGKWFTLGFCAFLARLGEGGGNFNIPGGPGGPSGGSGGPGPQNVQEIIDWIQNNLALVLTVGIVILILIAIMTTLIPWVSSRGKFMFIHALALNHAEVKKPWHDFRDLGNNLFKFKILFMMTAALIFFAIFLLCLAVAWADIQAAQFETGAITAIVVGALLLLPLILAAIIVSVVVEQLIVPRMYAQHETIGPAFRAAYDQIIRPHFWTIGLYFLMRLGLTLAAGMAACLATCATCCLTIIPYLGTVILLPIFVFLRCYSLYFVQQFGPDWQIFPIDEDLPTCPGCGYDLRGNTAATHCPECGLPLPIIQPPISPAT